MPGYSQTDPLEERITAPSLTPVRGYHSVSIYVSYDIYFIDDRVST